MDRIVLDQIPLEFDRDQVLEVNEIRKGSGFEELFMEAMEVAKRKLSCKAVLKWVDVGDIKDGRVQIEDVEFESRIMADNLKNTDKVFLYVLAVGKELDDDDEIEEPVIKDMVKGTALYSGMAYVQTFLKEHFGFDQVAMMNPGSLPDWPIENNEALFRLIGGAEEVGATLNEHHYIIPWYASSGILFENGDGYQNCMLCKKKCVKRRAPFDQKEYDRIFA